MKLKKFTFIISLALCAVSSVALTAAAAKEGTITDCDVHLNGYISGVEGPLTITDKIWYNANLTGSEDEIECVVSPTISHGEGNTAYVQKRFVSDNKVSCGYGGSKAILKMHLCSVDGTISDALE